MIRRDRDSPWKSCGRPVQFLVNKVRKPPDPLPDQRCRTSCIQKEPGVELIPTQVVEKCSRTQQEAAEDMQTAFPDSDNTGRIIQIGSVSSQDSIEHVP